MIARMSRSPTAPAKLCSGLLECNRLPGAGDDNRGGKVSNHNQRSDSV